MDITIFDSASDIFDTFYTCIATLFVFSPPFAGVVCGVIVFLIALGVKRIIVG